MSSRTFTLTLLVLTLSVVLSGIASTSCSSRRLTADLVIRAAAIYTAHPARPKAEAVAVRGGRIIDVGRKSKINRLIGKQTTVLDYDGVVLPGLIDAHGHLASLGRSLSILDLVGTRSKEEIRDKVVEAMSGSSPDEWIIGRGWDQNDWDERQFPSYQDLRGTEARPVTLWRVDGHAMWVNRIAMRIAGISSATPNPAGGRILHDASGEPTGILIDNAMDIVSKLMPKEDAVLRHQRLIAAIKECNRYGLVGVGDAGVDSLGLVMYRDMAEKGELSLRVYAMLDGSDQVFAEQEMLRGPQGGSSDMLRVRSVKMFADGALGSRGAALLEPYTDDPGNYGLITTPREKLARMTSLAMDRGFQVCVHAIGDSANRMVLDVYSAALLGRNHEDHRLRIEHAQILDSLDILRFGEE
ncbi:MAG: amidohydrolase, partial [bacterium]